MDLKVKDVADLLNVTEATVLNWVADGKIPAYRLNQQYCFSRGEIQNWMMNHKNEQPFAGHHAIQSNEEFEESALTKGGIKQFSLFRALHKGHILRDVPGATKEIVMREAVKKIAPSLGSDKEMLFNLLWDRERLQPTALNNGIGVPHTRDFLLKAQDVVFVVFPHDSIDYGALDGNFVHTLFFLFACEDKRHLHLLAKIALLCSQQSTVDFLRTRPSKEAFLDYIKDWETSVAGRR